MTYAEHCFAEYSCTNWDILVTRHVTSCNTSCDIMMSHSELHCDRRPAGSNPHYVMRTRDWCIQSVHAGGRPAGLNLSQRSKAHLCFYHNVASSNRQGMFSSASASFGFTQLHSACDCQNFKSVQVLITHPHALAARPQASIYLGRASIIDVLCSIPAQQVCKQTKKSNLIMRLKTSRSDLLGQVYH